MTQTGHSLTAALAQHLLRPICPDTRARARLHLLDWLGCVAGARCSPAGDVQRRLIDEPVTLRAALLGNVLEMDDVHRAAILHPGPVVWPAALGDRSRDLDAVLDAGVRGYEATIAVGATFDAAHYGFWHNTATAGVFGAAAAGLPAADAAAMTDALGLAGARDRILPQIRALVGGFTRDEIIAKLEGSGLPFAPIGRPEDMADDPHLRASGALETVTLPDGRAALLPAVPLAMDFARDPQSVALPEPGADGIAVLTKLGYSPEDAARIAG